MCDSEYICNNSRFADINKIDSIIYFDDLEDMYRFEFEDITSDQVHYIDGIKRTSLDINMGEIKHILNLISHCHNLYTEPSLKFRTFPRFIARYGLPLTQTDIEKILQSLPSEVFCKGSISTDNESWRKIFLKFEFYNSGLKFSNGRSLSKYGLPLVIYIVIAENLHINKSVALVSFTSHDFERCMLAWDSAKRVNLNYVEKIGSAYIVSVVAKPYSAEDPFFEFYISETSYNKIIHLIEALTVRLQMKYPLHYRRDAYMTHVQYQSLDPINHGLPIPIDYIF